MIYLWMDDVWFCVWICYAVSLCMRLYGLSHHITSHFISLPLQLSNIPFSDVVNMYSQDVAALQRLVNASIAALRNASNSNSPIPSTQSSPRTDPPNIIPSNGKISVPNEGAGSGAGSGVGGRGGYPPVVRPSFQPLQQQQSSRYSYWSTTNSTILPSPGAL